MKTTNNKTLVLLTESYPFGGFTEPSFIRPEIEFLSKQFDKVIILPYGSKGEMLTDNFPSNVYVDCYLQQRISLKTKIESLFKSVSWSHLIQDAKNFIRIKDIWDEFAFSAYVIHIKRLLEQWIIQQNINLSNTLFYTFWFEFTTTALSLIPNVNLISRAHGHDIFTRRPLFISSSWRKQTLSALINVYVASEYGAKYIQFFYPEYKDKIHTRHLGSPKAISENPSSKESDNHLSILSCARLSPEKGVNRQLRLLIKWAKQRNDLIFDWTCIGDGPQKSEIEHISKYAPDNFRIQMLGAITNEEVHHLLSMRHFDFSMLMSKSEGGCPIAATEALSYGIPVIATSVGGLPELLINNSGLLLSDNIDGPEFCKSMDSILPRLKGMRINAYTRWREGFNSVNLRESFANEIQQLIYNIY